MKVNESTADRIIRAVLGVVLLFLGLGGMLTGSWTIIADVLGAVMLLTAAIGFCPLYAVFKFSIRKS